MRSWIVGMIVAVLLGASAAAQDRVLVLEGGTVIDGTGRGPVADAVVVVEGSRIKAVGTRGQVISPMKAIQGATLWAAEVIGQAKDLGSIEPGKLADFTVIEGNPLADIGATKNVRMVIKGGQVMDTAYDPKWVNPVPRRVAPAPQTAR